MSVWTCLSNHSRSSEEPLPAVVMGFSFLRFYIQVLGFGSPIVSESEHTVLCEAQWNEGHSTCNGSRSAAEQIGLLSFTASRNVKAEKSEFYLAP